MGKTQTLSTRDAIRAIGDITVDKFWNAARKASPSFASVVPELSREILESRGYESFPAINDTNIMNQFIGLSLQISFNLLTTCRSHDPLPGGLIQRFTDEFGGITQRISIRPNKGISPKYLNIPDGASIDQQKYRANQLEERFWKTNWNWQNWATLPDNFNFKLCFTNQNYVGQVVSGILEGLYTTYMIAEYEVTMDMIGKVVADANNELQATQKQNVGSYDFDAPTEAQMLAFINAVKDVATDMEVSPVTSAYNSAAFETYVSPKDCVLLLRAGVKNKLQTMLLSGIYNPEMLTLPFQSYEVKTFGNIGYKLVEQGQDDVILDSVYDDEGTVRGLANAAIAKDYTAYKNSSGQWCIKVSDVEYVLSQPGDDNVEATDPAPDTIGILCQKGVFFFINKNGYIVEPAPRNAAGRYQNFWASRPENTLGYDKFYDFVRFDRTPSNE